ncbi:MAG TPA: LytTR family DNA-binding domain-containing protein [Thermoanaerobaculia bacterium]|nr:LytTR family DNA-binding domain-containing protein [Thermoanaerobaculia bacterium]
MSVLRAVIVEDEPLALARLSRLLHRHDDVTVVGEAGNAADAATLIQTHAPELLFLDIEMPHANGFELLHGLESERRPAVIFTTAHPEFAHKAFEVNAADYLVKPFDDERLTRAMDRARRFLAGPLPHSATHARHRERYAVRVRGEIVLVNIADVEWVSAEGNYARLHAAERSYLIRDSMQRLEETLDPALFARVHRSAIVNLARVKKLLLERDGSYEIVLESGATVPVGATYRARVEQFVGEEL